MIHSKVAMWIAAFGLFFVLHATGFTQAVNNGEIHGVVLDPSGAAVVGAQVRAISASTGIAQTTVTGGDGSYVLADLQVGGYSLEVSEIGRAHV